MMNAYSNMSGPPRSSVHVVTHTVGKQIVFNMQNAGFDPRLELNQTMQEKAVLVKRRFKGKLNSVFLKIQQARIGRIF